MCIYCGTTKYRKIYEQHYGAIPREENGRTYDIHHIDGDRANNDPSNLVALSIKEHYDTHHAQGDLAACVFIGKRAEISPLELAELARNQQLTRLAQGVHQFQHQSSAHRETLLRLTNDRIKNGTHAFTKKWTCSLCGFHGKGSNATYRHHLGSNKCIQRAGLLSSQLSKEWECPECSKIIRGGNASIVQHVGSRSCASLSGKVVSDKKTRVENYKFICPECEHVVGGKANAAKHVGSEACSARKRKKQKNNLSKDKFKL